MSKQYKFIAFKSLCLLFACFTLQVTASAQDIDEKAMKCRFINDRMQRLLCFDNLFNTPVPVKPETIASIEPERAAGPLRTMAMNLESLRQEDDPNWVVRMRPWYENTLFTQSEFESILANPSLRRGQTGIQTQQPWSARTVDVFMTMQEASASASDNVEDKAMMMLSCENDISTLAVILPKAIRTLQANISLSGGSGSVFRLHWRDVEDGRVIMAGRGLESIDTIKTLANYKRLQLQVNYPDGAKSFIFDMNDIASRLKPLRAACHW